MIGFSLDDGAGTVDLLNEHKTDHLVGKGHRGEGDLLVGSLIDGRAETVRATDDED